MTRVLVVVCALGGIAHADKDADAVKKVITAQVATVDHGDGDAFAASFAPDAYLISNHGYFVGADAKELFEGTWSPGESHDALAVDKAVIGHQGDVAWATVDVTDHETGFGSATYKQRITELLVRENGAWKSRAFFYTSALEDKPANWAEYPAKAENPPGTDGASAPLTAWLKSPADLAAHLHKGADVIVLGSGPGERGGASLLASWKKLAFAIDWARTGGDGKTYAWVAARVSRTVKVKGKDTSEPYWAMLLAVKGATDWEIVSVHYGQQQPGE